MRFVIHYVLHTFVWGPFQDQELSAATDGSYLGERHFRCPPNKGLFVKLRNCRRDSRFPAPEMPINQVERCNSIGEYVIRIVSVFQLSLIAMHFVQFYA